MHLDENYALNQQNLDFRDKEILSDKDFYNHFIIMIRSFLVASKISRIFSDPVSTRRCFDVYTTSIMLKRRLMDVKIMCACAYWVVVRKLKEINVKLILDIMFNYFYLRSSITSVSSSFLPTDIFLLLLETASSLSCLGSRDSSSFNF